MTVLDETSNGDKASINENDPNNMQNLLLQLRERLQPLLKKYPAYNNNYFLQRWLQARKFNIDEAEASINWSLRAMDLLGVYRKKYTTFQEVRNASKEVSPLYDYFPGGPIGFDKNGNIIILNPLGALHPRQVLRCARVSEFMMGTVFECEGIQFILRDEEKKRGKKLGVVLINDLQNVSFEMLSSVTALKIYFSILQNMQKFFPDCSVKIYVVNVPFALYAAWSMMEKVIAKETIGKIEILDGNFKNVLVENHGAKYLPEMYGGTMKYEPANSEGNVDPVIREKLQLQIEEKRSEMEKDLQQISVAAGEVKRVSIMVDEPGSKLFWYFKCSSDIEFSVEYNGEEVWPQFRLSTQYVPEYRDICCTKTGFYDLVFDNSYGLLWSKKVQYAYRIIPNNSGLPN